MRQQASVSSEVWVKQVGSGTVRFQSDLLGVGYRNRCKFATPLMTFVDANVWEFCQENFMTLINYGPSAVLNHFLLALSFYLLFSPFPLPLTLSLNLNFSENLRMSWSQLTLSMQQNKYTFGPRILPLLQKVPWGCGLCQGLWCHGQIPPCGAKGTLCCCASEPFAGKASPPADLVGGGGHQASLLGDPLSPGGGRAGKCMGIWVEDVSLRLPFTLCGFSLLQPGSSQTPSYNITEMGQGVILRCDSISSYIFVYWYWQNLRQEVEFLISS